MQKFEIASVNFKKRIVMAPMVPFYLKANDDGCMSAKQIAHYSNFGSCGMGLIISQSLAVSNMHSIDGGACDMIEIYMNLILENLFRNAMKTRFSFLPN